MSADDEAKVQLVLNGVSVTNTNLPVISGTFVAIGDTNTDAVIFCKEDLTLNGTGSLQVVSTKGNGVSSKPHKGGGRIHCRSRSVALEKTILDLSITS